MDKQFGAIQEQLQHNTGPLEKYRQVVTGRPGNSALLLYEILTTFVIPMPGSIGIRLRQLFLPFVFKEMGSQVAVQRDVSFRKADLISIGSKVNIAAGVSLDVKTLSGRIVIQDRVRIGRNTLISCPGGTVILGEGTMIGHSCRLGSLQGLTVGSDCRLDNFVCIVGAGHRFTSIELPIIRQPLTCKGPTVIGDNVLIGRRTTVLDGVRIGNGAIIEPGSLVNSDIDEGAVVGGIPATVR